MMSTSSELLTAPRPTISRQMLAFVSLACTLALLALIHNTVLLAAALLVVWSLTLRALTKGELVIFSVGNLVFFTMDVLAVKNGVFSFSRPDLLGLPLWELFMWGSFMVHGTRAARIEGESGGRFIVLFIALFSAAFALAPSSDALLAITTVLLSVALLRFHTRGDFTAVGYFICLGACVEAVGVHSGAWSYPSAGTLGFPLWFATLWGGVGLIVRRFALPLVEKRLFV